MNESRTCLEGEWWGGACELNRKGLKEAGDWSYEIGVVVCSTTHILSSVICMERMEDVLTNSRPPVSSINISLVVFASECPIESYMSFKMPIRCCTERTATTLLPLHLNWQPRQKTNISALRQMLLLSLTSAQSIFPLLRNFSIFASDSSKSFSSSSTLHTKPLSYDYSSESIYLSKLDRKSGTRLAISCSVCF